MEWKEIQKRQSVPGEKKKIYNALAKAQFETWNRGERLPITGATNFSQIQ